MKLFAAPFVLVSLASSALAATHQELITADKPVAYWRFDDALDCCAQEAAFQQELKAEKTDVVSFVEPGPRSPKFPGFDAYNLAADFTGAGGPAFLRVKDPGAASIFDFGKGDTFFAEAWVQCDGLGDGQNVYIAGKGRTANAAATNQNWAFRLTGARNGGKPVACVSFLFRDEKNAGEGSWHRWISAKGFAPGPGWHHVAMAYKFGDPTSAKAWINGAEVPGKWDMGGPSELGPVQDDDDVWIGGSMGGASGVQFSGRIDELAIYRTALTAQQIKARAARTDAAPELLTAGTAAAKKADMPVIVADSGTLPEKAVRVEIMEFPTKPGADSAEIFGDDKKKADDGARDPSWSELPPLKTTEFTEAAFALAALPAKYSATGVKTDRSRPFLVRVAGVIDLPAGEKKFLLRANAGSRLALGRDVIAQTSVAKRKGGDLDPVPDLAAIQRVKELPLLPPGHSEALETVSTPGGPTVITLEAWIGGKGIRPEAGQLAVWMKSADGWTLLAPEPAGDFSKYAAAQRERIDAMDRASRRVPAEDAYWKMRHDIARQHAKPAAGESVNAFIAAKLGDTKPAPIVGDAAFLRRVTLDTIGLIPTAEEVSAFLADKSADKRAKAIDRLLADPRWADHWTAYWQDVLAENPNMLKGTLNNTGPFRWWIHESLLDNKPMDRFVTELIMMEGSANYGGPAGFGIATQNDLPSAAKAQVLASAFLASEMKCARCHDAVHHSFEQKELFQIAAMLGRAPMKVPETSLTKGLSKNSHVTVTLKAGEIIEPHFPFSGAKEPLPGVLRRSGDSRELLAAIITDPRNDRFAQVVANRIWRQFMGVGIVDPVDDWETAQPSHKELLQWLARELATHNYDAKHIARLILNSAAYQREFVRSIARTGDERTFAGQTRRRLTAEQLLDSLMLAAGLEYDSEPLTFDPEGRQDASAHNNLGTPRRAWEFASLSNERDRPALAKPRAQTYADLLTAFGWRESRPDPRSTRDHDANVSQPALLANGTLAKYLTTAHDGSAFTTLALKQQPVEALVRSLFLRIAGREPSATELRDTAAALTPGYDSRLTGAEAAPPRPRSTKSVSWASHLNPDATNVVLEIERDVKAGPTPSPRLTSDWRDRFEDTLWALLVQPEFAFVP